MVSKDLLEFLEFHSLCILLEFQMLHLEEGFRIPLKWTTFGEFEIPLDMNSWSSSKEMGP